MGSSARESARIYLRVPGGEVLSLGHGEGELGLALLVRRLLLLLLGLGGSRGLGLASTRGGVLFPSQLLERKLERQELGKLCA